MSDIPIGRNVLVKREIQPQYPKPSTLEGIGITHEYMEATARHIVENHFTAFPFQRAGDTLLSRLIDTRVAQMEMTSDAMQGKRSMRIEDVDAQLKTMHKISKILESTDFDTYANVMQAEFDYAFNQSVRQGQIDEVLCGYIMRAQHRTSYKQGWFNPLMEAVQKAIIVRREEVANVTGLGRRGPGGRGGGAQGRGRGPPRRGGNGAWGQGDSSSQSSHKSGETSQSGEGRGGQKYKQRPADGIAEGESDESDDEYDKYYVCCIDEQVTFKELEHEKREQEDAVTLTEARRREIAMWSKQASNISKEHLECLKISKQEEVALKRAHIELHQFKGELKGQLIFDVQARLQKEEPMYEPSFDWFKKSNLHNLMLRCVSGDISISDEGFNFMLRKITPLFTDPTFVAESNAYVPRLVTRLCHDIKYSIEQESGEMKPNVPNGVEEYSVMLRRANQAQRLTQGLALQKYGNWHKNMEKAIRLLGQLANGNKIADERTEAVQRDRVCMNLECVIDTLKPPDKFAKEMYKDTIKADANKAIANSVQYEYVRKRASNAYQAHQHVLLRLPNHTHGRIPESPYERYCIQGAEVETHVLNDGTWTVESRSHCTTDLYGQTHKLNNKNLVASIPGELTVPSTGEFMLLSMNTEQQTEIWTGSYKSNEVHCMTLTGRSLNKHILHTFRVRSPRPADTSAKSGSSSMSEASESQRTNSDEDSTDASHGMEQTEEPDDPTQLSSPRSSNSTSTCTSDTSASDESSTSTETAETVPLSAPKELQGIFDNITRASKLPATRALWKPRRRPRLTKPKGTVKPLLTESMFYYTH